MPPLPTLEGRESKEVNLETFLLPYGRSVSLVQKSEIYIKDRL